jgi:hypothetical protein
MGTRGRTSIAEHSVASNVVRFERPGAPCRLTESQADLWFEVVNRMPADWFSAENLPLLEAYVVSVDTHDRIAGQLKEFKNEWLVNEDGLRRFARLTEIQGRQAKLMKDLATSMRLTQQSSYSHKAAATAKAGSSGSLKPWEQSKN